MIKKILIGLLAVLLLLAAGGYAYYRLAIYETPLISQEDRQALTLMPLPARLEFQSGSLDLTKGISVSYPGYSNEKIRKAAKRFIEDLSLQTDLTMSAKQGNSLRINCMQEPKQEIPGLHKDESYTLTIDGNNIALDAPTQFGVLHGLQTLRQLAEKREEQWVLPEAVIEDHPRFPWRGLMLDVSRHWMPKEVIIRTLDAMAAVKMNVFHWHLADDQGFRVESDTFPRLHQVGANGKYYTQEEIRGIIQYAADRGIRVVPEFDLPGHSKSWQMAYPRLKATDRKLQFGIVEGDYFSPPINPASEKVYQFLDRFVGEMAGLFPDSFMHIGGDEVDPAAWQKNSSIQEFMKQKDIADYHGLQAYFNQRMHQILQKHDKRMMGWQEIRHANLGNDIIIQAWKSHKALFESVKEGSTAILSAGYYLDHKLHAGEYYSVDPEVLPGAVNIVPDSSHWKMYELKIEIPSNSTTSQLVLFDKNPQEVYGFMSVMDDRTGFKGGVIKDNKLEFTMQSQMGDIQFEGTIHADSIAGKVSLGMLNFPAYGPQTGGSGMENGAALPEIETMEPLTTEEKQRILGGEACMWAEVVDADNVDTRIWPSAAAIAEKLWSPRKLTESTEDMYRRLPAVLSRLEARGLTNSTYYNRMLTRLAGEDGYTSLKTLVDILEEVKYYARLSTVMDKDTVYFPELPLNSVVDAARPESLEARAFNKSVTRFLNDTTNEKAKTTLLESLQKWETNHQALQPFIQQTAKLQEIADLSAQLATVSGAARKLIQNKPVAVSKQKLMEQIRFLETGHNGVLVAVAPGLRQIVSELHTKQNI